jgi:ribosomal protein S14
MAKFRYINADEYKRFRSTVYTPTYKVTKYYKEVMIFSNFSFFIKILKMNNNNNSNNFIIKKCLLSGKFNSINIPFKMSRMIFNYLAYSSQIRGLYKASW